MGVYLHRWLEAMQGSVRDRSREYHERVVRLHLNPNIGGVKRDGLSALQVQAICEIIHATLHKALKQAVVWTLIPRSVSESATPPRATRREIAPLSQEQTQALLEAARDDRLEALYVLAVSTGMRQGELLGLQWKDVDLDRETLKVDRSVYEGVVSPPKTDAGRRAIPTRRERLEAP